MTDQLVIARGEGAISYHTDIECVHVTAACAVLPRDALADDAEECRDCAGTGLVTGLRALREDVR